jgi:hypothetical protein
MAGRGSCRVLAVPLNIGRLRAKRIDCPLSHRIADCSVVLEVNAIVVEFREYLKCFG